MKIFVTILAFLGLLMPALAQNLLTPAQKNSYQKVTSCDELAAFVKQLDKSSDILTVEEIGKSVEGRSIFALKFSSTRFGEDKSKVKVLFFAQQHGNEQSGKEGALLLAAELVKPENRYLFDKIDFVLIPQVNPDGSEANKRRNGNNMDLNRNHLILTEPETQALHRFFDTYLFEVNMDVHEYSPYGGEWEEYGYRKNADVTMGATTNPNVSEAIRTYSNKEVVPYILKSLSINNFSSSVYCPGGPPEIDYIRHSTFDINDGRQSFGIQNTLSFIQEGMNGTDTYIENLKHRAEGQKYGMRTLLDYVYEHKNKIKKMVAASRKALISGKSNAEVSIQSDHAGNGQKLTLQLFSYSTLKDTTVIVSDYRPVVKSVYDVTKPAGYLIPKANKELVEWVGKHDFVTADFNSKMAHKIEQYFIRGIDSIDFERDIIVNPTIETTNFSGEIDASGYIYIPTNQLKGNLIVLALEPKSMLGLVTYSQFAHLLKSGEVFPVLRVMGK